MRFPNRTLSKTTHVNSVLHTQLGKVDALERLKTQVESMNTKVMHLLPSDSREVGLIDYLENGNVYLNTVYAEAKNIIIYPRGNDGSPASSRNGIRGKVEVMEDVIRYIKSIKVS